MKQLDLFGSATFADEAPSGATPVLGALKDAVSSPHAALAQLSRWQNRGWIRRLDVSLARFVLELDPKASGLSLILAALVSHQLGRSHVCLLLTELIKDPDSVLGLPPEDEFGRFYPDRPSELLKGIELEQWLEALHPDILVGQGQRVYLRRLWQCEQSVIQLLKQRIAEPQAQTEADISQLEHHLERLFPGKNCTSSDEPDWQKVACANSAQRKFSVITGGPGTGKTTTVVKLLALLSALAKQSKTTLEFALAAPTGKAAARLTESIAGALGQLPVDLQPKLPDEVKTLHRLLGASGHSRHFKYGKARPLPFDWVVVDEASMVDLEMFQSLLQALRPDCGLVLLGDKDQLSSVEAGSVLGDLCIQAPYVTMLQKSHRFDSQSGIGLLATAVNRGEAAQALALLKEGRPDLNFPALRSEATAHEVLALLLKSAESAGFDWAECLQLSAQTIDSQSDRDKTLQQWGKQVLLAYAKFQVLSPLRSGPWGVNGLNELIAQHLKQKGLLDCRHEWYAGRPVILLQNDYSVGLMNGDVGITLNVAEPGQPPILKVAFATAEGGIRWVRPSRLPRVQTAFAMTVHKSQGSEFEHAALVLPPHASPVLTRELVYTAITRAKKMFSLLAPDSEILGQAITKKTLRAGGLLDGLNRLAD